MSGKYTPITDLSPDKQEKRRQAWREKDRKRKAARTSARARDAQAAQCVDAGLTILSDRELETPTFRIIRGEKIEVESWLRSTKRQNHKPRADEAATSARPQERDEEQEKEAPQAPLNSALPPELL